MTLDSYQQDDIHVVTLQGEIDGKTAPEAQQQITPLMADSQALLLDMRGVDYMSSAGLRMMLLLYRQMASKDGKVALVGLSEEVEETMSATGFLEFFVTAADVDAGLAALRAS